MHLISLSRRARTRPTASVGAPPGLRRFLRDTRAGATSIAATAVVVMLVAAGALIVDHNWLVDQRDEMKRASEAAAAAATIEIKRPGILGKDDEDLDEHLDEVAKNYILLNLSHLPEERFKKAKESLQVKALSDRAAESVNVSISANLGGTLFSRHLPILDNYVGPETFSTASKFESFTNPIEVVLAIDISFSMTNGLDDGHNQGGENRMSIVKRAAQALVGILGPDAENNVAVGIVPWQTQVRLDDATRKSWAQAGWAKYPKSRHYHATYECKTDEGTQGVCQSVAETQPLPDEDPNVEWQGCLDEHRVDSSGLADLPAEADYLSLPSSIPFAQGIFASMYGLAHRCHGSDLPENFRSQRCYGDNTAWNDYLDGGRIGDLDIRVVTNILSNKLPQFLCPDEMPAILPLSSDVSAIKAAIDGLQPVNGRTYSATGLLWGQRLLSPSWNAVWGGGVHPVDPDSDDAAGARKAIVLLTDGEDSVCGVHDPLCKAKTDTAGFLRDGACTAAKATGTEIFVIAAMAPELVSSDLASSLQACSSRADNPDGTYVFINNSDADDLEAAFADIATQLRIFRRIY